MVAIVVIGVVMSECSLQVYDSMFDPPDAETELVNAYAQIFADLADIVRATMEDWGDGI